MKGKEVEAGISPSSYILLSRIGLELSLSLSLLEFSPICFSFYMISAGQNLEVETNNQTFE